jgi:chemosensory pili system protein ChpA (sensor histidine kinase/response regulator)
MIFAAGFSTAETVSQVSGRGVGMDVVKSEISALGGRIDIASTPGAGTSIPHLFAAHAGDDSGGDDSMPPVTTMRCRRRWCSRCWNSSRRRWRRPSSAGEVEWRGSRYPFSYLPHLLGDTEAVHEVQRYNPVVLLQSGASQAAVVVDVIEWYARNRGQEHRPANRAHYPAWPAPRCVATAA